MPTGKEKKENNNFTIWHMTKETGNAGNALPDTVPSTDGLGLVGPRDEMATTDPSQKAELSGQVQQHMET